MNLFYVGGGAEKPLLSSVNITQLPALPPFPLDVDKSINEQVKLDLNCIPSPNNSSQPQSSRSTVYEQNLVPIRPFVSSIQRSFVRLPDNSYRMVIFFYWCLSLGFQKLFSNQNGSLSGNSPDKS